MTKKTKRKKLLFLVVVMAFCLSNATMGELLGHEHEVHYEHNTVHVHHSNGDHGSGEHGHGETEHRDIKDILSFDYFSVSTSACHHISFIIKHHVPFFFSLQRNNHISWLASKNLHHVPPDRYYSTSLYQLNSTYLI
ncbi:MAG: hypothetical protein MRJ65_16445 [Candidatus Brocadiaceae bacterium]|nr:hypothetical protein [Candidatus Brocadiaceae bacterium]